MEKYINPFTDFGFKKLFGEAEIANFNQVQLLSYEDDLKVYRDMKGVLDTAREEGIKEGIKEGKIETARNLLIMGIDIDQISKATGLSIEEINDITLN